MASIWRDDFPKSTNPLSFFYFSSRPHWKAAFLGILAVVIGGTIYSAGIPYSFKMITDAAALFASGGEYEGLMWAASVYIGVSFVSALLWRLSGYAGSYWATGVRATARHVLTSYVMLHSRSYFSDRFAGSISNKVGHASNGVRDMVDHLLWEFLSLAVSIVSSFVIAFITNPVLGGIFLAWSIVVIFINIFFGKMRVPLSEKAQGVETLLTGSTVDLFSNIGAVQDYAHREFEIGRIQKTILTRRKLGLKNWHFGEAILTFNGIIQALFAAGMVFAAIMYARSGAISPGDIVLVLTIIFRVEDSFLFIGSHINRFSERWGEIRDSLQEILEPHDIVDVPDARELKVQNASIVFDNVRFIYRGANATVLENFSLSIRAGQRVGLVGRSGAGKSTLMKLLLRHYDVQAGHIEIDGQNIVHVTQDSLHEHIAVVPQEPLLFHRSIRENIAYGKPEALRGQVIEAAKLAYAHEFIERLPQGYDSLVGERGVKLSGGERQRVVVARAILKNAPILLLDEATSALDSESEVAIQKALHVLMQGKTVIAIAHRLSTLREMDRILVLDGGQIVEDGTHADLLLKKGGVYAELWAHQAGGFLRDEE